MAIAKPVDMNRAGIVEAASVTVPAEDFADADITSEEKLGEVLAQLEIQMREAAKKFEFERAAVLRDRIRALKQRDLAGFFSAASEPAIAEPMAGAKSNVPAPPSKAQLQ